MYGVVVAIDALMTRREVIPAVVEANAITVDQVEIQAHIGADPGEELAKGLVILQNRVDHVDVLRVVVHIGVARAHRQPPQGEAQLAVDRQQVVGMVADEGEIVLHHAFGAEVEEHRNARRGVHQRREGLDVVERLQGAAGPKVPTVAAAVVEAIKELGAAVDVDGRAVEITHSAVEQHGLGLHMAASPFDGGTQAQVGAKATVAEGHSAVVVAVGHVEARIKVEPDGHLALADGWLHNTVVGLSICRSLPKTRGKQQEENPKKDSFCFHKLSK